MDSSVNTVGPGATITLTATANQDVGSTGSHYKIWIRDHTTGNTVGRCGWGTVCSASITVDRNAIHTYAAYVASAAYYNDPLTDIQATSNGFSAPNAGGPTGAGEVAGGSNPSEECSQRCHGDPVNAATGEFWETTTDLAVPGNGPGLAFTRSYAATRASVDGPLGYGWTHGYAMTLAIRPGAQGTTLATATQLEVRQENGSVVTFAADGNGNYAAASRVLATLVPNTSATLRAQVAQQLRAFGAKPQGFDNDVTIGATALERGIPLITGDRALWNALSKLGGDARWFRPGG